jgi:hypothetical protein
MVEVIEGGWRGRAMGARFSTRRRRRPNGGATVPDTSTSVRPGAVCG